MWISLARCFSCDLNPVVLQVAVKVLKVSQESETADV